jgi:hypothetical protein
VPLFIPILKDPMMEMMMTTTYLSIQIRLHLKFSLEMRARGRNQVNKKIGVKHGMFIMSGLAPILNKSYPTHANKKPVLR